MRTIKLHIAYHGARYVGWQIQAEGLSVQGEMERVLERLTGHPVRLIAAGRTDAGVHARCMAAHFQTPLDLPLTAFREGVNRLLPEDIAVQDAFEMPSGFHARFDAKGKHYRYTLWCAPVRSPLEAPFSWWLRPPLDLEAMRHAARQLTGIHDFAQFRIAGCAARTTVREIFSMTLTENGERILIDVRGSGFLRGMVRLMVGALVDIGRGRATCEELDRRLHGETPQRRLCAPPQGLCLMEVYY
ncbi:MAG: tRNA pseudouridine(38-40) synthase TruA [Deltaproteobacteria bacterium]|nr:tRNA pseudouridine(38-40) synthase TruA [Deltaproteobacteria bacterium]